MVRWVGESTIRRRGSSEASWNQLSSQPKATFVKFFIRTMQCRSRLPPAIKPSFCALHRCYQYNQQVSDTL